MANFMSDNCSGAHPEIMQALLECNSGAALSYGGDPLTLQAEQVMNAWFETPVAIALMASGTAANCLALSLHTPPDGVVFCHKHAHIYEDEYGAPGLFTGGAMLIPLEGEHGKISAEAFQYALVNTMKPGMLSLTQASESGTVYSLVELAELIALAKKAGLKVHMDGARFANALAVLGCTPAELTWKLGVDVLSLGFTKNGCMAAEAVIAFDDHPAMKEELLLRRRRSGHTLSKMRFISAQFLACFNDDLWLKSARHANAMALKLAQSLKQLGFQIVHPVEANEVFVMLPKTAAKAALEAGHLFFDWPDGSYRLVTSFATTEKDIATFIDSVAPAAKV